MTKDVVRSKVTAPGTVTYIITTRKNGDGAAGFVTVTDNLDDDLVVKSVTPSQGTCDPPGPLNTISCHLGSIFSPNVATVTIVANVDDACGTIENKAHVSASNESPEATENNDSNVVSVTVNCPDVKVEKTAKALKVNAGEDAVYNITVTAIANAPSTNVVLTDGGLDDAKVSVGGTDAGLCDPITAGTLTCNFGTLDPAGVAGPVSRSITLTHHTTADQCPSISNIAEVTADFEETLGNNQAGVTIAVNCPDVHVTKTANTTKVTAPGTITYTITTTNDGPGEADDVLVTDDLPGLIVKVTTPHFDCPPPYPGNTISCDFGTMPEGENLTVTVVVNVDTNDCGKVENHAHVTASNEDLARTGNNDASVSVTVNCPDVRVQKSVDPTKVTAPGNVTYTLTAQNAGPGVAHDVDVSDNLDDGLIVKSVTPSQGTGERCGWGIGDNIIFCELGDVAAGGSAAATFVVNVPAGLCHKIQNHAHVTASNEDPSLTGNNDSNVVSVTVNCPTPTPTGPPNIGKTPRLANLWLCNTGAPACGNKASGVEEVNLNVNLDRPITSRDPKCLASGGPAGEDSAAGAPPPTPSGCPFQQLGAFEFEVRFDDKLVSVQVDPGTLFDDRAGVTCRRTTAAQGRVRFGCSTKGKPQNAPSGPGTLAVVRVRAQPVVYSMLIAAQESGLPTQLLNQGCKLFDLQGHAIPTNPCTNASVTIRYLEGDVHADCLVDVHDQQQAAFRWGAEEGFLLYNPRFDLEPAFPKRGDGDIDIGDVQFVSGRHGSSCKAPHPPQPPVDPKGKPVTPTPTATAPPLPDLQVRFDTFETDPELDDCTIHFTVMNKKTTSVPDVFWAVQMDWGFPRTGSISPFSGGASIPISLVLTGGGSGCVFDPDMNGTITVDDRTLVDENNEDNNVAVILVPGLF